MLLKSCDLRQKVRICVLSSSAFTIAIEYLKKNNTRHQAQHYNTA